MTTKNLHQLFIPAFLYNTEITATMCMLLSRLVKKKEREKSQSDKQPDKQAFCAAHHSPTIPPAALRSSLSKRNQYPTMIKLIAAHWPAKFSKETRQRWLLMFTRRRPCGLQQEKWPFQNVCTPYWQDGDSNSNLNTTVHNRHFKHEFSSISNADSMATTDETDLMANAKRQNPKNVCMVPSQHFLESNFGRTSGDAWGAKPMKYTFRALLLCWPCVTWIRVSYQQVDEPQDFKGPNSLFSSKVWHTILEIKATL